MDKCYICNAIEKVNSFTWYEKGGKCQKFLCNNCINKMNGITLHNIKTLKDKLGETNEMS